MRTSLKSVCLFLVLGLAAAGAVSAGCGVKDTHEGTLKSVDAEDNAVVVVASDGKEVRLELTDQTDVTDTDGNEAELAKLVGKRVKVVSEHAKVESIEQVA